MKSIKAQSNPEADGWERPSELQLDKADSGGVKAVACGGGKNKEFAVALRMDGTLMSWGYGGNGQLGTGNTANAASPEFVIDGGGNYNGGGRVLRHVRHKVCGARVVGQRKG